MESSAVTGAFYVRLPQTNLPNQSILLRYVIITDSLTTERQVWINELPEVILSSFEALKKNFSILSHFPRFQSFIEAMEKTETQKPAFKLIKRKKIAKLPSQDLPTPPLMKNLLNLLESLSRL